MQENARVDLNRMELDIHEGLAIVELRGARIQFSENGFAELIGYESDEVSGLSLRQLFPLAGEILDPVEEGFAGFKGELELHRKDGIVMPVYVSIVPARAEDMADVAFMLRINRIDY